MMYTGFSFNGVPPALGRTLTEEDERPGAPPVVVIADEEWQREFGSDPKILERTIKLDDTVHAIVGVMPQGFAFPVAHRYWVALRLTGAELQPRSGAPLYDFGRLADGLDERRARRARHGRRPDGCCVSATHKDIRPHVMPVRAFLRTRKPRRAALHARAPVAVSLLLVLVAVNVAILVYARTAARAGRDRRAHRAGRHRRRVVGQLFIEALVLSLVARRSA